MAEQFRIITCASLDGTKGWAIEWKRWYGWSEIAYVSSAEEAAALANHLARSDLYFATGHNVTLTQLGV